MFQPAAARVRGESEAGLTESISFGTSRRSSSATGRSSGGTVAVSANGVTQCDKFRGAKLFCRDVCGVVVPPLGPRRGAAPSRRSQWRPAECRPIGVAYRRRASRWSANSERGSGSHRCGYHQTEAQHSPRAGNAPKKILEILVLMSPSPQNVQAHRGRSLTSVAKCAAAVARR